MRRLSVLLSTVAAGVLLAGSPAAADDLCYRVRAGGYAVTPVDSGEHCVDFPYGAWCWENETWVWYRAVVVVENFCYPAIV